jgi:OFA family oxalate/formate antiporter-like MFS transporter
LQTETKNRWLIAASAVGIHLSIGSVYSWSVFSKPIVKQTGWDFSDTQFTFSIAIIFLGLSAAFLGHFVEKYGPRLSGIVASLFFGAGIAGSGLAIITNQLYLLYLCYGVLGGIGLGVGYITPVSTLVKWFPDKRGLATGLAIMGFGFASLIASPIIQKLIITVGLANTFFIMGAVYFAAMVLSSQYLAPPSPGWIPKGYKKKAVSVREMRAQDDLGLHEALRTRRFYFLWLMLFINVTCGIAIISVASPMGQEIAGLTPYQAAAMVGLMGLFNGGGRIGWAALSDYAGRANTYSAFFALQILTFYLLPKTPDALLFQVLLFLIMTCYGGGFACIPAYIGDLFGTKHLATIHGAILTAWAAAGLVGPILSAWIREQTGNYSQTLFVSIFLFVPAFIVSLLIRLDTRKAKQAAESLPKERPEALVRTQERSFPARVEFLPNIMDFVTAHALKAGLSAEKVYKIQLAVEEAVANICNYAYLEETAINRVNPYQSPGSFVIRARQEGADFVVDVIDEGLAFDPLTTAPPDPKLLLEDPALKGMGIHLIRQVTDEVRYNRSEDKNVLTLIMKKGL